VHIHDSLRRLVNRWETRIFAAEDVAAGGRGWQISRPPNGFGRCYRDPRWDLVSACEWCGRDGGNAVESCQSCAGRGTVRHHPTNARLGGAP
jgi:hypothetical protein